MILLSKLIKFQTQLTSSVYNMLRAPYLFWRKSYLYRLMKLPEHFVKTRMHAS